MDSGELTITVLLPPLQVQSLRPEPLQQQVLAGVEVDREDLDPVATVNGGLVVTSVPRLILVPNILQGTS